MTDKLFLENWHLKTHQLIVKSNSRNTNWIVNPWQVKSAEHMEKFKIKSISIKVARPSIFVGTPSIFESLRLRQIDLYRKNIIAHVLHTP